MEPFEEDGSRYQIRPDCNFDSETLPFSGTMNTRFEQPGKKLLRFCSQARWGLKPAMKTPRTRISDAKTSEQTLFHGGSDENRNPWRDL
jgi:hypothetical protein